MSEDKKYQVFVSSTFVDLQNERRAVMTALMEAGYIPAGMEFFGAVDEAQFEFIKRVIDRSDYYIVIVGNRYGSTDADGFSYTEKEYDYAVKRGLKVIALLHRTPENLPHKFAEKKTKLQRRLAAFRKKLEKGRVVTFWTEPNVLPKDAVVAMSKQVNLFPATGWVRGDQVANATALAEMNDLRKKISELQGKLAADQSLPSPENIADYDELFTVVGTVGPFTLPWSCNVAWGLIAVFALGNLLTPQWDETQRAALAKTLYLQSQGMTIESASAGALATAATAKLHDNTYQAIRIQLMAYRLVAVAKHAANVPAGYSGLVWSQTPSGQQAYYSVMVTKTKKPKLSLPAGQATPGSTQ
jgi:hypothetical protein